MTFQEGFNATWAGRKRRPAIGRYGQGSAGDLPVEGEQVAFTPSKDGRHVSDDRPRDE